MSPSRRRFCKRPSRVLEFENRPVDLVQLSDVLSVNALLRVVGRRAFPIRSGRLWSGKSTSTLLRKRVIDGLRADIRFPDEQFARGPVLMNE